MSAFCLGERTESDIPPLPGRSDSNVIERMGGSPHAGLFFYTWVQRLDTFGDESVA
jgi:hypothetical protein